LRINEKLRDKNLFAHITLLHTNRIVHMILLFTNRNEVSYEFTIFYAKQLDSTQMYVSSFLIINPPVGEADTLPPCIYFSIWNKIWVYNFPRKFRFSRI